MINTRHLFLPFAFCAAALISPLCAQEVVEVEAMASDEEKVEVKDGNYFKDRGHDVLDLLRMRAGIPDEGRSIGVKARVTTAVQAGYVAYQGPYVGMDRRAIGTFEEKRREGGISGAYGSYNEMDGEGNYFMDQNTPYAEARDRRILRNAPHWDDGRRRALSCGVELATPIFAFDLGVYPGEAIDLVLGFFTVDIVHDDHVGWDDIDKIEVQSTYPEADKEAPFKDKRMENQAFLDHLKEQKAEEYEAFIKRKAAEKTDVPAPTASLPKVESAPSVPLTGSPKSMEEAEEEMEQSQKEAEEEIQEEKNKGRLAPEPLPGARDELEPDTPQSKGKISEKETESALEKLEKQRAEKEEK